MADFETHPSGCNLKFPNAEPVGETTVRAENRSSISKYPTTTNDANASGGSDLLINIIEELDLHKYESNEFFHNDYNSPDILYAICGNREGTHIYEPKNIACGPNDLDDQSKIYESLRNEKGKDILKNVFMILDRVYFLATAPN